MKTKAIIFEGANRVGLAEFPMREPGAGEVLVQAEYTCISPGTELRCLCGEEAAAGAFPMIPGYAMVGRVVRTGSGGKLSPGTPVYCMGTTYSGPFGSFSSGHVSCGIVAEAWAIPIPEGLELRDAVIAVLGGIALHGRNLVPDVAGKRVLVAGLGVIGQFSARLFALAGAEVTACDLSPQRVALASAAGIHACCPDGGEALLIEGGARIVVDATGSPKALAWSLKQAHVPAWNPTGSYAEPVWCVVQGSYPADVPVNYPTAFMSELRMAFPRSVAYSDIADVMQLIRDEKLNCSDLVSLETVPEEAPQVYAKLGSGDSEIMTAIFRWTES